MIQRQKHGKLTIFSFQRGQAAASSGFVTTIPTHWFQHRVKSKGLAGEQVISYHFTFRLIH